MGAVPTTAGRVRPAASTSYRIALAKRIERNISITMWLAHGLGAFDVFALLFFVLPLPGGSGDPVEHLMPNLIGFAVYLPLAGIVGTVIGKRRSPGRAAWLHEGRDPTPEERKSLLDTPVHCFQIDAGLWLGAALLFFAINVGYSSVLASHVACTIVLGGLTTCAVTYLLVERLMRPMIEIALASGPVHKPSWPGVEGRLVLAWLLATGVPLVGLGMVGIDGLTHDVEAEVLARSMLVLGGVAFLVGLAVTLITARALSTPLTSLRRALGRVEAGDLAAGVRVDDASELGLLQSGFNRMVEGLRDRERMQDLYARQVGPDVAEKALADEPRLGGEVREIAVLFVDLVGSTQFSLGAAPEVVVDRLNRFFRIVVEEVDRHGGWVNKFEGDAALCVFGAPTEIEDAPACALATARDLHTRLARDMPGTHVGIGVSAGPAVAGWVGAEHRFEYTVIGDPVNEAARLCELAKGTEEGVRASYATVVSASGDEPERWAPGEETVLRGRTSPTRVAAPVTTRSPRTAAAAAPLARD